MLRKGAIFALGFVVCVALGFALAHAHALKTTGAAEFSAPCEPAPPAFKASGEAKILSSLDWSFDADAGQAPGAIARQSRAEAFAERTVVSAPRAFPPLFRRPPPFAS